MNKKKEVLKLAKKIGSMAVEQYSYKWPPICMGILHQPQRSKNNNNVK